jgi:hypothetical protein
MIKEDNGEDEEERWLNKGDEETWRWKWDTYEDHLGV